MVDILYSLVDVNERLNRLVLDPLYIRNLDMTIKPLPDNNYSIHNQVLDRICKIILPRIHHQVNKLTVEPQSIKHILVNPNFYPQLYSLSFVNFQEEILHQYLTDNSNVRRLAEQIMHLKINIRHKKTSQWSETLPNVVVLILSLCKRLIDLNFCQLLSDQKLSNRMFDLPSTSCMSSSLSKLRINVETLDDCLYLLDGRLDRLSTFIIHVTNIVLKLSNIDNTKKLLNLKCFSLSSFCYTLHYDDRIVPLLRRMINLEELKLYLSVVRVDSSYIDGTQMYKDILIYIPRLNKLKFSINTCVEKENIKIDLPSNKDIQCSFIEIGYQQVGSYADSTLIENQARCHIYSLPYQFENFHLNSCFQGGTFDKVRYLMMTDERPFEYKLFKIISQDFPFLKGLRILNDQPPKNKQHSSRLVIFPHLRILSLRKAHLDYAEQFLFEKNTQLHRLLTLDIKYETLVTITNSFTDDAARLNCAKLKCLHVDGPYVRPENFHQYFSLL